MLELTLTYELSNTLYYSVETTTEYLSLEKDRADRGEIGKHPSCTTSCFI
ncbi:MAG: hypothetical protein ACOCM4_11950 [Acetivibrio ethanolgignens]